MPFHASRTVYAVGDLIRVPPDVDSFAYQLAIEQGHNWRDLALEQGRNGRAVPRRRAVFAANTPGNAARFLMAVPDERPVRLYEVTVAHEALSPMALIEYIDHRGENFGELAACVEEYWAPTREWQFLEYVTDEMVVTAVLGEIDVMVLGGAQIGYMNDRDFARNTWSNP